MPIRKIESETERKYVPCKNPGHSFPSMIYLKNGVYENVCPGCGKVTQVVVNHPSM